MSEKKNIAPENVRRAFFRSLETILEKSVPNVLESELKSSTFALPGNRSALFSSSIRRKVKFKPIEIHLDDSLLSDSDELNESSYTSMELDTMQNLRKPESDVDNHIISEMTDNRSPLQIPHKYYESVTTGSNSFISPGKKLKVPPLKLRLVPATSSGFNKEILGEKLNYKLLNKGEADSFISPEQEELITSPEKTVREVNIARISDLPVASLIVENIKMSAGEKNMCPNGRYTSRHALNSNISERTHSPDGLSAKNKESVTPKSKSKCTRNLAQTLDTHEEYQRRLTKHTPYVMPKAESFVNFLKSSEVGIENVIIESDDETNKENLRRSTRHIPPLSTENGTTKQSSKKDKKKLLKEEHENENETVSRSFDNHKENQRKRTGHTLSAVTESAISTNDFEISGSDIDDFVTEISISDDEENSDDLRSFTRQIAPLSAENGAKKQWSKRKGKLSNGKKESENENFKRFFDNQTDTRSKRTRHTYFPPESEISKSGFENSEDEENSVSETSENDQDMNKKNLRRSTRRIAPLSTECGMKKPSSNDKRKLFNERNKSEDELKNKKLRRNTRSAVSLSVKNEVLGNSFERVCSKKKLEKEAGIYSEDDIPLAERFGKQSRELFDPKNVRNSFTDSDSSGELFCPYSQSFRKKSKEEEPIEIKTSRTRYSLRRSSHVITEKERAIVIETPPRTPKSIKTKMNSFRSPRVHVRNLTPCLGERRTPVGTPATPKERARMLLLGSAAPESLPCRENEFKRIYEYLFDKIKTETGGFMYISGAPGTGKTATVERVVKKLVNESKNKNCRLPDFKVIKINGVRLTNPREIYRMIWRQFSGKTVGLQTALNSLNELFQPKRIGKKRSVILLIIDEFDCLSSRKQDVMYKILEWQKEDNSHLIVLSIANTFDFFENKKLFSRMKFDKLPFIAYTFRDLEAIISNRLEELRLEGFQVFAPEAIEFMARKVAALTGDARRALNISRQVLDIHKEKGDDVPITIDDVVEALKTILRDPVIQKIKNLHIYQKIGLRAVRDELIRTSLSECSLISGVWEQFKGICSLEGLKDPEYSSVRKAFQFLADSKFISVEEYPLTYDSNITLNVESDAIYLALHAKS